MKSRTMTELRTFRVKAHCYCGGEWKYTGTSQMTNPPAHVHHCSQCGDTTTFRDTYPNEVQTEVGEPTEIHSE